MVDIQSPTAENRQGKKEVTRMLAINVSIPNLTVARLEQFPSPQMTDNKPSSARKPHVVIFRQSPFAANAVPKLVAMANVPYTLDLGYVFIGYLVPENPPLQSISVSLAVVQLKLYSPSKAKNWLPW